MALRKGYTMVPKIQILACTTLVLLAAAASGQDATVLPYNSTLPNPDTINALGSTTSAGAPTADPDGGACIGTPWRQGMDSAQAGV